MEKLHNHFWEKQTYSSLFHDERSLDGKGNNFSEFFQELCVKIWVGSRNTWAKNFLFQHTLCYCNAGENLESFLSGMGYDWVEVFWNLDECKKYLSQNNEIYFWIKRWDINIAIVYDDMTPVWVVLAKQVQSEEYIRGELEFLAQKIVSIINFNI